MRRHRVVAPRPSRHTLRLACQVVHERDFRLVADRIENLSPRGALVSPADPVLTGERVLVSFQLPRSGRWLDLFATVRRVVHGRRPNETTRKLGLEFDALSREERYLLRHVLMAHPVVPPGGRPGRRDVRAVTRALARASQAPSIADARALVA